MKWSVKITKGSNGSSSWEDFITSKEYSGILTPPTVSHGRVYVSVTHTHEVVALDAGNGAELWRFAAGARVDGPPTIYGGLCVFGSADGWLYCLNATSGKLIWRFFAGVSLRKMVAYGQIESPWPHSGSAMIYKGYVYVVAGRFSETDGGYRV